MVMGLAEKLTSSVPKRILLEQVKEEIDDAQKLLSNLKQQQKILERPSEGSWELDKIENSMRSILNKLLKN